MGVYIYIHIYIYMGIYIYIHIYIHISEWNLEFRMESLLELRTGGCIVHAPRRASGCLEEYSMGAGGGAKRAVVKCKLDFR